MSKDGYFNRLLGLPYVKLTPKVVRYRRKDIYAWLEKQVVATVA